MQWRGFVSNDHPSEVLPLQWPEISGGSLTGTNHPVVQLGVSLEPLGADTPVSPKQSPCSSAERFALGCGEGLAERLIWLSVMRRRGGPKGGYQAGEPAGVCKAGSAGPLQVYGELQQVCAWRHPHPPHQLPGALVPEV